MFLASTTLRLSRNFGHLNRLEKQTCFGRRAPECRPLVRPLISSLVCGKVLNVMRYLPFQMTPFPNIQTRHGHETGWLASKSDVRDTDKQSGLPRVVLALV